MEKHLQKTLKKIKVNYEGRRRCGVRSKEMIYKIYATHVFPAHKEHVYMAQTAHSEDTNGISQKSTNREAGRNTLNTRQLDEKKALSRNKR